jgi:hypothetical protein
MDIIWSGHIHPLSTLSIILSYPPSPTLCYHPFLKNGFPYALFIYSYNVIQLYSPSLVLSFQEGIVLNKISLRT